MATIALVDDDPDVLALLSSILETEGYHVVAYPDGPRALNGFKSVQPDLVILDIRMPQMDGIELLRRLRQKSEVPIIVVTGKTEEIDELFALRIGADDFIRKPFSQGVLVERVRTVLRRFRSASERDSGDKVMERGHLRINRERHACSWKGENIALTVTEFRLVEMLAARPGVIKSRDTLMDAANGDEVYVDDRTIDSHIKRLRKKFRAVDETCDPIETLHGVGYRFKES